MLDRSAVGELSFLSSKIKWQWLPAGDTLRSVLHADNHCHFVLLDKDAADLSNITPSQWCGIFDRWAVEHAHGVHKFVNRWMDERTTWEHRPWPPPASLLCRRYKKSILKPPAREQVALRITAVHLFISLSIAKICKPKNAIYSTTKQFRAMVSIDAL